MASSGNMSNAVSTTGKGKRIQLKNFGNKKTSSSVGKRRKAASKTKLKEALIDYKSLVEENVQLMKEYKACRSAEPSQVKAVRALVATVKQEYVSIHEFAENRLKASSARLDSIADSLDVKKVDCNINLKRSKRKTLSEQQREKRRSESLERVKEYFHAVCDLSTIIEANSERSISNCSMEMQNGLRESGLFPVLPSTSCRPCPSSYSVAQKDEKSSIRRKRQHGNPVEQPTTRGRQQKGKSSLGGHLENAQHGDHQQDVNGRQNEKDPSFWVEKYLENMKNLRSKGTKSLEAKADDKVSDSKAVSEKVLEEPKEKLRDKRRGRSKGKENQSLEEENSCEMSDRNPLVRPKKAQGAKRKTFRAIWF